MKTPTPLVAKNGESEWSFKENTVIAVRQDHILPICDTCIFNTEEYCSDKNIGVHCVNDFLNDTPFVVFNYKK